MSLNEYEDRQRDWDADQALTAVRRDVDELIAADDADARTAIGEAADGRIRVTAANGRVTDVELDPRVMRMTSLELAQEFALAVNAALAELDSGYTAAAPAAPDLKLLAAELAQAQQTGAVELRRVNDSINQALAYYSR